MGRLFRERRWRELLNLIDQLPRWSLYQEAKDKDPELARQMAGVALPKFEHRLSEWTPEREAIASLYDLLAIFVANRHTRDVETFPKPISALQASLSDLYFQRHLALVRRLLPDSQR